MCESQDITLQVTGRQVFRLKKFAVTSNMHITPQDAKQTWGPAWYYNKKTRDTYCADLTLLTSTFALYFPNYVFYIPNPCVLGTRPVLPCKNGYCCKFELARAKSVLVAISLPLVAHRWNCHTSKFDTCCAYHSGEIRVLQISQCFPWATDTVCTLLFSNN